MNGRTLYFSIIWKVFCHFFSELQQLFKQIAQESLNIKILLKIKILFFQNTWKKQWKRFIEIIFTAAQNPLQAPVKNTFSVK